jgi:hypothetical protein
MTYYIFLDVDGVLNDEEHFRQCWEMNGGYAMHMNFAPFDPRALTNLMNLVKVIRKYGEPKIILSSSWRLHEVDTEIVKARIAEYGLRIIDKTPYIHSERGLEIQDFLSKQEDKDYKFVILDDDLFDIKDLYEENLVLVDRYYGLSGKDVDKALNILELERE